MRDPIGKMEGNETRPSRLHKLLAKYLIDPSPCICHLDFAGNLGSMPPYPKPSLVTILYCFLVVYEIRVGRMKLKIGRSRTLSWGHPRTKIRGNGRYQLAECPCLNGFNQEKGAWREATNLVIVER